MERRSLIEWAARYVGDPNSFGTRANVMMDFLRAEGMDDGASVLELGCGALNLAAEIKAQYATSRYVGLEPNGWLVEVGLDYHHWLPGKIEVLYRDDFDAVDDHKPPRSLGPFDFVIAHSILSHAAHWQLQQCLANVRKAVDRDAVFLASLRLADEDSIARQWCYPDVSYFRLDTVETLGFHFGWRVEHVPEYRERMMASCPNDSHDWLRLTAIRSASDFNDMRLEEEARVRRDEEILRLATARYKADEQSRLAGLGR